mmetsp:Transcript_90206/g.170076  ORF Transcript_90206/g.170076 Transcript_90206/m.170076 type:complete len:222 (-) Transcript_90206:10-675(-)
MSPFYLSFLMVTMLVAWVNAEDDHVAFVQSVVTVSSSTRRVGLSSSKCSKASGCVQGGVGEEDTVSYAQAHVGVDIRAKIPEQQAEDSEDDLLSYMQTKVTSELGTRQVGAKAWDEEEEGGIEEEEGDMAMFVQAAVTVDSGTRHVGTGCVSSSADEAACLAKFNGQDDMDEGIEEDGADVLSYMQSEIGVEQGPRQVGAITEPVVIGEGASYYTEDVMSL